MSYPEAQLPAAAEHMPHDLCASKHFSQEMREDYFFFLALVLEGESFVGFSIAPERMRRLLTVSVG